jgi:hypothetical protein
MPSNLSKVFLFRMTHIKNIPHILDNGITHVSSPNRNSEFVSIGDNTLISKRASFEMPNGEKLGAYIPFYFGARMPMLYVIQKAYNGVNRIAPENIVYCVSTVRKIIEHDLKFVFTDGHAIDSFSDFFDPSNVQRIENIIDQKAIGCKYWVDENDLDLKRRKEAEFLVYNDIPVTAIDHYIVYNESARNKLVALGIDKKSIFIKSEYYF